MSRDGMAGQALADVDNQEMIEGRKKRGAQIYYNEYSRWLYFY